LRKKVFILGSTGSIGINTLNVIRQLRDMFDVVGVSANRNIDLLKEQIDEFEPEVAIVRDRAKAEQLREELKGSGTEILAGEEGLLQASREADYDIMVAALVGFAGLAPTIEGIKRKKRIALANKETLVVAGEIINRLVTDYGSEIIPVDSEHSAIFQSIVGENRKEIRKILLTASGGPFRTWSAEKLRTATIEEALAHPNWKMGNKVTIDSATMMNKGLEVIEAHWLFGLPGKKIEVVVHPQSIIHSMVEFDDGSIKAQLSLPDMKLPIQYALTYPRRVKSDFIKTEFPKIAQLTFFEPDFEKFECLRLAYESIDTGGTAPCILNAANEIAVGEFLKGRIRFTDIPELIKRALQETEVVSSPGLDDIFKCDRNVRSLVRSFLN